MKLYCRTDSGCYAFNSKVVSDLIVLPIPAHYAARSTTSYQLKDLGDLRNTLMEVTLISSWIGNDCQTISTEL